MGNEYVRNDKANNIADGIPLSVAFQFTKVLLLKFNVILEYVLPGV